MGDVEARLRAALEAGAKDAPDGTGLVAAVHRRSRERRRRRVLVAGVVLGAVAVPGTLALLGGDGPGPEPPASDASVAIDPVKPSAPGIPSGLHPESWRDLEILVPNTWGHGTLATWCLTDREPGNPVVERPGGVVSTIGCRGPELGYGVQFLDPGRVDLTRSDGSVERVGSRAGDRQVYPAGSWVGLADAGGDAVARVVARNEYVARFVLGSVRRVDGLDSAGCAPRAGRGAGGGTGTVSVCRYAADGWLEQSERLDAAGARAALRAVEQAPVRRGAGACPPDSGRHPEVELVTGSHLGTVRVVWAAACAAGRGVFVDGVVRELTPDVLYWALSPGWSGAVDASVPLPDPLRG